MITYTRSATAALAVAFLAACGGNRASSTSATTACWPESFQCEGYTPGFWSNKHGCWHLGANPDLYDNLNLFLDAAGYLEKMSQPSVDTCAEVEAILKVDAGDMSAKLLAMWTAFALNHWNFWDEDCFGGPIDFKWDPEPWLPGHAGVECEVAVQGWLTNDRVTFEELLALANSVYQFGTRCEQETLKNFFDAANNEAMVCVCECPKEEPPKNEL